MSSSERTLRHPALSLSCLCSLALSIFPACSVDLSTLRGRPHNDASLDVPTGNGTGDAIGKFDELPLADLQTRNQLAMQAVNALLCKQKPVYLVQDDQALFNTIYPDLARRFALQRLSAPLTVYKITETVDPCQS